MAAHSSTLAWKIPWMEEPGRLPSMGSHRVGHDGSALAWHSIEASVRGLMVEIKHAVLNMWSTNQWNITQP